MLDRDAHLLLGEVPREHQHTSQRFLKLEAREQRQRSALTEAAQDHAVERDAIRHLNAMLEVTSDQWSQHSKLSYLLLDEREYEVARLLDAVV